MTDSFHLPELYFRVRAVLQDEVLPVYLVGGAVRDAVYGRDFHDLDFAVAENAIKLAFRVGDALRLPAFVLDGERDVGRVMLPDGVTTLDFARFRPNSKTPEITLEADLKDRDFTLNAMALPLSGDQVSDIIDPTNGLADLEAGVLRQAHDQAIAADPIRALRAIRMALKYDLTMAPETQTAINAASSTLDQISAERIRDELIKLLVGDYPDQALTLLQQADLLDTILPEVAATVGVTQSAPHYEGVFEHTVSVLRWLVQVENAVVQQQHGVDGGLALAQQQLQPYAEKLAAYLDQTVDGGFDGQTVLRLGALFHDVGKPSTKTVEADGRMRFFGHDSVGSKQAGKRLRKLKLSNDAIDWGKRVVAGHMSPLNLLSAETVSRRAIYRYFKRTQQAGVLIGLLTLADHLATHNGRGDEADWRRLVDLVATFFDFYFERYDEVVKPIRLLDGGDLIKTFDLKPGPIIGRILAQIEEAQAAGDLTTKEEALALARAVIDSQANS